MAKPLSRSNSLTRALIPALIMCVAIGLASPAAALPNGTRVQTYQGNLDFPIDMAWARGTKKIFFTEKNTGRVRIMKGRNLLNRPCVDLPVNNEGERGALGIALHPRFKRNHFLYVYYTNASPVMNRVDRYKVRNDRCRRRKSIAKIPSPSTIHNGGQIEFAGGKLYISTGDGGDAANSQNRNSKLGKILRLTAKGRVPSSNPFGNPVWSYGHRNPFGLAHKPGTKRVYETENGPQCDDELNVIVKSRNYGWGPGYSCGSAGVQPNPKPPEVRWGQVIVPTDLGWYSGRLKRLRGLLGGDFHGGLHRFPLNDRGTRVRRDQVIHRDQGILDVAEGPGRWLYFLTDSSIKRVVKR